MNSQLQREQFRNFCLTHRWIVVLLLYKWLFSRSSVLHRCLFPHKSWIISSVEWERKTRLSTTLRKIQELRGKKKSIWGSMELSAATLRQCRRLFLLEGSEVQILSLQDFSWPLFQLSLLLHSILSNCICQHHRENSATCWWLSKLGFALWILMFFGELCLGGLGRACHSERHFILCIVISFAAEFKSVIASVVWGRSKH